MPRPSLARALTTWDVVALGLNGVIGGGIFLAPSTVARHAGSWSLLVYVFSGALVALIALCFAEVGGRFARPGGPYLYASEAFGPCAGFQVGWFTWLARITSLASLANGLVDSLSYLVPPAGGGAARLLVLAVLLGGLAVVNVLGVSCGAWTIDVLTGVKLVPLTLFILVGLPHVAAARLAPLEAPTPAAFADACLFMVYVFGGFEVLTFPASEMVDPRRAIPRAILVTLGIVAVVYVGVHAVAMGTLPGLAASRAPVAEAARGFAGPVGALAIGVGAILSICGTQGGLMLTAPRLLYAMAERGQLPETLTRVHPRFRTPHNAIVIQGALALALAAVGTFEELAKLSAIARIVSYASTCAATPVLRRRAAEPASFTLAGGPLIPAAAILLCIWLVASGSALQLALGAGALAAGLVLYGAWSAFRPGAGRGSR